MCLVYGHLASAEQVVCLVYGHLTFAEQMVCLVYGHLTSAEQVMCLIYGSPGFCITGRVPGVWVTGSCRT